MPYNKRVFIFFRESSDETLQKYVWLLNSGFEGQWIGHNEMGQRRPVAPGAPLEIPKVIMGPAFREAAAGLEDAVKYLIVVQGSSGAAAMKLMVCETRDEALRTIFHESLNGYSTVFTG